MNQQTTLFSNEKLMAMIIPLFLEQLLIMLVGMADTLVVSYAGEAAVSGVSLVNQFNTIFIYLFTALASGGAVVISQYIGRKKNDDAGESASQLLSFSAIFSILIAVMVLIGNEGMLRLMFGKVEDSVMHSCITYLRISAYSYPALAVYNAGAALFRSIGKTSVTMYLSVISNIINVIGNFIGVLVLRAGVAGVAYPSLIARTFSAVMITVRYSKWDGKRYIPVSQSSIKRYRCTFWNISDCCKWCCTKYLVIGCAGGSRYGSRIYNGHWTVYGKWGCRCCGALF